ncbi:hypothetical protein LTR37_009533 [Vermiconidia calcicola]|uniref:Uncharacterized protein n=1 Tax=Vermiconidia calcicola TaxID=1690605 RepID=A0ACC3N7M0_9PEZI|nr:hypothetical protein LTR37_009533 [Vermiconidia calcicola]
MATVGSQEHSNSKKNKASPPQHESARERLTPQRPQKRQKVTRACDSCKTRKRRCTGEQPWANDNECTYNALYTRGRIVPPLTTARSTEDGAENATASARRSQPRARSQQKAGPEAGDAVSSNPRTSRAASPEEDPATLSGQYSGPTSAYSFLRRAWRRFGLTATQQEEKDLNQAVPIFSYGDKQLPRNSDNMAGFAFPDRQSATDLFSIYFDFAMPTYRFLHQPRVTSWLESYHEQIDMSAARSSLLPARQAVVLMVLATGALFKADSGTESGTIRKEPWQDSEPFFQAAQVKLASETGKLRLESVQARLAMCLYLLHTSRPNQAWYTFGITSQILMALGMHRARASSAPQLDTITTECRKRAFWAAFTLDTYLSVILGRPALIHMDDVDQHFPESVDDDEVTPEGIVSARLRKDPIIQASIFHAKVTRIAKKALKEQYSVQRHRDLHRLNIATKLNAELVEWRKSLPVVLSGTIHPSSLIQIFQRQIIVLELAHSLATILINRPLLLVDSNIDNSSHVNACLSAAKTVLDVVLGFVTDTRTFPTFWYTQYVVFNALSIVYIWLIQRRRGRLASLTPPHTDDEFYQVALMIQKHLAEATQTNAPSLRYSIILEELQQETARLMAKQSSQRPANLSGLIEAPTGTHPYASPLNPSESSPSSTRPGSISWDSLNSDFPLDPDIWLQLDSFPFRK